MNRPLRRSLVLLVAGGAAAASGCGLLTGPRREFASQDDVLRAVASASGYRPDPSRYRLVRADVAEDSITFQYTGPPDSGDIAWVIRFAEKTTEQKPAALISLENLIEAIAKGKKDLEVTERGRRPAAGEQVEYARYRYRTAIRGPKGEPFTARGIAAIAKVDGSPAPVIYQMNVENYAGDRPDIGWADLEPLLEAIPGEN